MSRIMCFLGLDLFHGKWFVYFLNTTRKISKFLSKRKEKNCKFILKRRQKFRNHFFLFKLFAFEIFVIAFNLQILFRYNGQRPDLTPNLDGDSAVIIGNGNVSIDCARVLLSDPERFRHTDIANYALKALDKSQIKKVTIVGRRGPLQVNTKYLTLPTIILFRYLLQLKNLENCYLYQMPTCHVRSLQQFKKRSGQNSQILQYQGETEESGN